MRTGCARWTIALIGLATAPATAQESPIQEDPKSVRKGLVVSVDPIASRIGANILRKGGNAVDAAIATQFALAVTYPAAGNIGGGGFMMVRLAKSGECFMVDGRETAPKAAHPGIFLDDKGQIDPEKVNIGWVVVGVPGTTMQLWTAHQKAGKMPWRELVDPAVGLAADGFTVHPTLSKSLEKQVPTFKRMGEPAKVYLDKEGKAPKPGSVLKLPELAHTLELIRDQGPDGFYKGETADKLDRAMRENGGLVRKEDLASYRAIVREPVRGEYRGYQVLSAYPPSGGGTVLIEMLNILEGFDVRERGHNTPAGLHLLAETMKRAYYDRAKYLGDADFVSVPLDKLLSKSHAEQWRKQIGERATDSASFGSDILTRPESSETTHFSVIDAEGNMVASTTTLEGSYGAMVIAPGCGFLLNNEMHDFNPKQGTTDKTGLVGTPPNVIAPGKRMLSSQTPTLVLKDNKPFLVLGSPGGRTITNTVLQVIVNVVDHGMPIQAAVDAPRVHHQWQPDKIVLERSIAGDVAESLRKLGHVVDRRDKQGDCHAILIDPQTGEYRPGIDRRILGAAAGF